MTNNDIKGKEEFSVLESTVMPTIKKIGSEDLSRLLESKKSYTERSDERIPYSINIWDHGGQNEFIITNHLFLSVEAFNLIVMDISLDLNTPLKQSSASKGKYGIPKTPAQILCYWLNALHVLAMEKRKEPNIALVLTHKDMIKRENPKRHCDRYIEQIFKCIRGKSYESYVRNENIFVVDNRKATEGDFTQIRNSIFAQIATQKTWGIERPTRWLKLEADMLQKAKENETPYLHISIVRDLASAFAMNERELESFLSFHHILGDMIYYPDKILNDFVVTNPQWLLDMFKALITPHEYLNRRKLKPEELEELKTAILSEESLNISWEGHDVQFLKDVMIKFDLMLPLGSENQKYLIPCMLPSHEVEMDALDPFKNMVLIYYCTLEPEHGDAMPVGTFHKLPSQCSKMPGWILCENAHLSYTQALIEIDDAVRMELKLQKSNSIDVSIWCSRRKLDDGYLSINEARDLIVIVHRAVNKCMKICGLTQKGDFKMLCPHWSPGEEYICLVTVEEKEEIQQNITVFFSNIKECTMHKKELEPGHFPWTKEDIGFSGKFSMGRIFTLRMKKSTHKLFDNKIICFYSKTWHLGG